MPEPCEKLEKCCFLLGREDSLVSVTDGWLRLFCGSREKSEQCARKQYLTLYGTPPPDNMAPSGRLL